MSSDLLDAITEILSTCPGLPAKQIAAYIRSEGLINCSKRDVNSCLYSNLTSRGGRFFSVEGSAPLWHIDETVLCGAVSLPAFDEDFQASSPQTGRWAESLCLYPWQVRALDMWLANDYRGIVEAVTGAGKTRLALAAIESEMRRGGKAAVIVPTIDLQRQWVDEIQSQLIEKAGVVARVGTMGDGSILGLDKADIIVATVQTACKHMLALPYFGLLVADEVHHYGAAQWSRALEEDFERRLGLTATYERDDYGVEEILEPYFGSYKYSLGYEEALRDQVIAPFRIAFVGVRFDPDEMAEYLEQDEKARRKRTELINHYGLTAEPFGLFMRDVQRLRHSDGEGARKAGLYLSAFTKRRRILSLADQKLEYLYGLAPAVRSAESTILFSQTREAAERAVAVLEEAGVPGDVLHAELEASERKETFDAFRDGLSRFIAAPKLLDEGVDVPDADLAIVLASSRSRRQMIQRMGRVIRKKPDGRPGRVVILYVEDTIEDPEAGAHEDFVQFVAEAAEAVEVFDTEKTPQHVIHFLNER